MHTLLPYDDYKLSALALSNDLLKQQIDDCLDILETLHETSRSKVKYDHPTVRAWSGSELQLCEFGLTCADQYLRRNGEERWLYNKIARLEWHLDIAEGGDMTKPSWFGKDEVHLEYQGLLRHLDPKRYEVLFPKVATCAPEAFRYPLEMEV